MSEDGRHPGSSSAASGVRDGDLAALLARVEGAEGADREIDCLICEWQYPEFTPVMRGTYYGDPTGEYFSAPNERGQQEVIFHARAVTASLDAALALCERVLPGSWCKVTKYIKRGGWAEVGGADIPDHYNATGRTAPLALLAAMLKAMIAQAAGPASGRLHRLDEPNPSPAEPSAGWGGIESAPRDGTHFFVTCRQEPHSELYVGHWWVGLARFNPGYPHGPPYLEFESNAPSRPRPEQIKLWMPLPSPPSEAARPAGDSDEVPGKPNETGELEEHKALSPLVDQGNGSSVASRGGTASPKSDSGAGH